MTLKGLAQSRAGLRRRLEVTEPLPVDGVGALGGQGPVGWRLRALAGKRPLQAILEVRTRRRPFDLSLSDETVAEAALDETTIVVGLDNQPVRLQRVEVEVEPAWVERLTPVVDVLRRECGLQPAALSKFEAGLLAAGLRVPPPPESGHRLVRLEPLGRRGGLRRAAATTSRRCSPTRPAPGSERTPRSCTTCGWPPAGRGPHCRCSRTALPVRARHVRTELGWLAAALGAVRDLDVQLERVEGWIQRRARRGPRRARRPGHTARPPARRRPARPAGLPRLRPLRAPRGRVHHHAPPGALAAVGRGPRPGGGGGADLVGGPPPIGDQGGAPGPAQRRSRRLPPHPHPRQAPALRTRIRVGDLRQADRENTCATW